jgi:hypothetical protein
MVPAGLAMDGPRLEAPRRWPSGLRWSFLSETLLADEREFVAPLFVWVG